ncbi:MAG: L-lysine 6-transaminase [Synergistetes bacterium]|nr:MAG: L-lysine 6-transaminase [bacterium 42_11]MBC7332020.1 L-lysine 6-transaminase [Synergistota bacterium]MDK2871169.1 L-lysine 6-transaminase [bacterium]
MTESKRSVQPSEVLDVLSRYMLVDGFPVVIDMEKSRGSWIIDARDGRKFLDFYSFFASSPLGMNYPKLANDEFKERVFRAAVNKVANSDIYTLELAEFVKTFMRVAAPPQYVHLFLIDGGALAVENALKVAFDWKVRKNFKKGYKEEKGHKVIHFKDAFHGRTGYTLSMTNTADPRKHMYFPKFNWPRVLNPKIIWPLEEHIEEVEKAEKESIRQIKQAIHDNPDDIAAIIIEPIQGEGGDNHFRGEFLKSLREIADEEDIMLIFDEVQCGMGITGKMWAFQHFDVYPDIIAFGKKSQVCGILVTNRVDEVENNCFVESSRINSTWGGNIVDMVRATRILEIYEEDRILDHVNKVSPVLHEGLLSLGEEFPGLVSNVRYRGLMAAIDFPTPAVRDEFRRRAFDMGILILACGTNGVRFRPALTITEEEIKEGIDRIRSILKDLKV